METSESNQESTESVAVTGENGESESRVSESTGVSPSDNDAKVEAINAWFGTVSGGRQMAGPPTKHLKGKLRDNLYRLITDDRTPDAFQGKDLRGAFSIRILIPSVKAKTKLMNATRKEWGNSHLGRWIESNYENLIGAYEASERNEDVNVWWHQNVVNKGRRPAVVATAVVASDAQYTILGAPVWPLPHVKNSAENLRVAECAIHLARDWDIEAASHGVDMKARGIDITTRAKWLKGINEAAYNVISSYGRALMSYKGDITQKPHHYDGNKIPETATVKSKYSLD